MLSLMTSRYFLYQLQNRTYGTTLCTSQGLTEQQVTTMTKHRDNNFRKAYRAEISVPVATTLAGFLPTESTDKYFVPRGEIKLPASLQIEGRFANLIDYLFPRYQDWMNELNSISGDKTFEVAANHFLKEVIPWLTKILIQDGIFWIEKCPENSAAKLFLSKMSHRDGNNIFGENYSQWARLKRNGVKAQVTEHNALQQAKYEGVAAIMVKQSQLEQKIADQNILLLNVLAEVRLSVSE